MPWWKMNSITDADQEDDVRMPADTAPPARSAAPPAAQPLFPDQDRSAASVTAVITRTDASLLEAVRAAGLTTPELFAARMAEHTAFESADKTRQEEAKHAEEERLKAEAAVQAEALGAAKIAASAAAVTAFGQGSQSLKEAQEVIGAQDSVVALAAMTGAYKAVRPAPLKPGAIRQTKQEQTQADDQALDTMTKAEEQLARGLNPDTVYDSRRAKPLRR